MHILIIGASSGIGRALAEQYGSSPENHLRLLARREPELLELQSRLAADTEIAVLDLAGPDRTQRLAELLERLPALDLAIYAAGYGEINPRLDWELCRQTLEVNVMAFTETANLLFGHFARQGCGHLAAISSVGGLRGFEDDSGYSASKAYMLRYLEGLARKARKDKLKLQVTTILPGFVDTPMAKGDRFFWLASPESAARQIIAGLNRKKRYLYVTRRWRLVAWLLKLLPAPLFERI